MKVTMIKSKRGKTKRKALILFLLSVFLKLTLSGIPSVVKICSAVEILTSKKKGRENLAPKSKLNLPNNQA
tara:strand:- start:859 stop:1071 length:213 start_codon:yes stop_codon:yes gene_type:complete